MLHNALQRSMHPDFRMGGEDEECMVWDWIIVLTENQRDPCGGNNYKLAIISKTLVCGCECEPRMPLNVNSRPVLIDAEDGMCCVLPMGLAPINTGKGTRQRTKPEVFMEKNNVATFSMCLVCSWAGAIFYLSSGWEKLYKIASHIEVPFQPSGGCSLYYYYIIVVVLQATPTELAHTCIYTALF